MMVLVTGGSRGIGKAIFDENGTMSNYFISGPPAMIKTFKRVLIEKGVPADQVLTDDWE